MEEDMQTLEDMGIAENGLSQDEIDELLGDEGEG